MSDYDKNFLKEKYKEIEEELSEPKVRKPNDHVLLIDGLNTFIRAFSVNPSLNEDGSHVGGLVGFLRSIRFAINKFKPTRCIVVFDGKGGSKPRQKIYSQYKAGRKVRSRLNRNVDWATTPQDEHESMKLQIGRLIEYLEHLPLTLLALDRLEADDIISYVTNVTLKESKTTIMSTDKDFLQLVSPRVQLYSPTKKITYDEELVKKEFGIYPQNMLTCRVIDGDKSDGIPGVRGIGIKTLIKEFVNIDISKQFQNSDFGGDLTPAQMKYCANDVIYLHRIHSELNKILEREKRIELYKDCLKFLRTRVELDLALFKDDIWSH